MNKNLGSTLAALAGCASASYSQHTLLDMQVSKDGYHWGNSITVDQSQGDGARVLFRAVVSWVADGSSIMPVGLASFVFQPVVANPRIGVDTVVPFNRRPGLYEDPGFVPDVTPLDGPFGRLSPFASSSPSSTNPFAVTVHTANSGGAPDGTYYRFSRGDITRWMGTGPSTGTAAVNNFNGAGGITCVQKSSGNVTPELDPAFDTQIANIELFRVALDTGTSATPWTMQVTAPLEGITRNTTTGVRQAAWFSSPSDNGGSLKVAVVVNPATITIVPGPGALWAMGVMATVVRPRRR